jgi:N-acetylglucosamine PTS system EIICBA or EIICB component
MGLTSFLTGVTEPIEFSFMFLAPALYAVHAVLTGTAAVLMHWLGVRLGFGFSAGLFDYLLNFRLAEKPLWLLPVGCAYFAVYFVLFRYVILRFDLRTPGREAAEPTLQTARDAEAAATGLLREDDFVTALGGRGNLRSVDACTTRLRLEILSQEHVNEAALRRLGAHGFVRPSPNLLQVVLGPVADQVAERIRQQLRAGASPQAAGEPTQAADATTRGAGSVSNAITAAAATAAAEPAIAPEATSVTPADIPARLPPDLLAALGGRANVLDVTSVAATRLRVRLRDEALIDTGALGHLAPRGTVRITDGLWHILVGTTASQLAQQIRALCQGADEAPRIA